VLLRKPVKRTDALVTKTMWKQIVGQVVYQVVVILLLVFGGDCFIPEFLTPSEGLPANAIYSNADASTGPYYVRSGRFYGMFSHDIDYKNLEMMYGPSRHFTMVFNTFIIMVIFNFFNCRKVYDEQNIFEGLTKSKMFITIVSFVTLIQLIVGNFGGRAFGVSFDGMDMSQWLMAVGFGFGTWVVSFLLKLKTSTDTIGVQYTKRSKRE